MTDTSTGDPQKFTDEDVDSAREGALKVGFILASSSGPVNAAILGMAFGRVMGSTEAKAICMENFMSCMKTTEAQTEGKQVDDTEH